MSAGPITSVGPRDQRTGTQERLSPAAGASTAEGELEVEIRQVREAAEPFVSASSACDEAARARGPLEAMVVGVFVRGLSMRDVEGRCVRRRGWASSQSRSASKDLRRAGAIASQAFGRRDLDRSREVAGTTHVRHHAFQWRAAIQRRDIESTSSHPPGGTGPTAASRPGQLPRRARGAEDLGGRRHAAQEAARVALRREGQPVSPSTPTATPSAACACPSRRSPPRSSPA